MIFLHFYCSFVLLASRNLCLPTEEWRKRTTHTIRINEEKR